MALFCGSHVLLSFAAVGLAFLAHFDCSFVAASTFDGLRVALSLAACTCSLVCWLASTLACTFFDASHF